MNRSLLNTCSALVAVAMLVNPCVVGTAAAQTAPSPVVIGQPNPTGVVASYYRNPANDPALSQAQLIAALRRKVRYVFVLFQENESFDHHYGTFPGANGLYSDGVNPRSAANTPGFTQTFTDTTGNPTTVQPFLIGPSQHASDTDDVDHSHVRMASKMDLVGGVPQMDKFAAIEEAKYATAGSSIPPLKAKEFGELTMAHIDCDTIPFLWNYANRFTLFDNIFQTTIGPSTPNALSMIAGQVGQTQWVKHPGSIGPVSAFQIPLVNDNIPFWGSTLDTTTGAQRQPADLTGESSGTNGSNVSQNLTFASLPLTLAGSTLATVSQSDTKAASDQADTQQDIPYITGLNRQPYAWRWYQEGYDHEVTDPTSTASHSSYIGHHNGPQYFGYVSNNPLMSQNMHGLGDFYNDIANNNLPAGGGVIYVRGGYDNIAGLNPAFNPTNYPGSAEATAVQRNFQGDDEHPGYSDMEISEAMVARSVNAIARSQYWSQSAIIITYDESEGDYDHVPPRILSFDPQGLPLDRGPRIPLTLISPYARAHAVSREEGDHNSVIALINNIFNLPPLADLPDELQARVAGQAPQFATGGSTQLYLGPNDGVANPTPGTGNLLSGFDPYRLLGYAPPLPATYAEIADSTVNTLPHFAGHGCTALGITTVDRAQGIVNTIPSDFNPRPSTFPQ